MNFNKQARKIIFSRKKTALLQPLPCFDNRPVKSTQIHNHLRIMLDSNVSYEHHIKSILHKVNKTISVNTPKTFLKVGLSPSKKVLNNEQCIFVKFIYIYIYIYIYICIYVISIPSIKRIRKFVKQTFCFFVTVRHTHTVTKKQKTQSLLDEFSYSRILLIRSHVCEW